MTTVRWTMRALAAALLASPALLYGQTPGDTSPWARRGRAVEEHRKVLQAALESRRTLLADTLRAKAPDLLPGLDPAPPPVRHGYQLVPRLIPDGPRPPDGPRRPSVYSWPWTDTLIDRASRSLDSLGAQMRRGTGGRGDYERFVRGFNAIAAQRRVIDAHLEHNWLWQRAIAADTARFGLAARTIERLMSIAAPATPSVPAVPVVAIEIDDTRSGRVVFRVPVVTDIEDTAFLAAAKSSIESTWSASGPAGEFGVQLEVRRLTPRDLYCGAGLPGCAPPGVGAAIDIPAHLARFPASAAILTTGSTQPYVIAARAMILGPRDITMRTLSHEFGHILGFEDGYLRGYHDLGADGFAILELVPDPADIMASSGFGAALPRHFDQLARNVKADRAMRAGLEVMYQRSNPAAAVPLFREVLGNRPDHYGATFQLARALDLSGDSTAAVSVWTRVLEMAVAQRDDPTASTARARLGRPE